MIEGAVDINKIPGAKEIICPTENFVPLVIVSATLPFQMSLKTRSRVMTLRETLSKKKKS